MRSVLILLVAGQDRANCTEDGVFSCMILLLVLHPQLLQVCAGWRASGSDEKYLGKCVTASVRYVPSYSTKLECQSCDDPWQATWKLSTAADAWNEQHSWPPDPIWTESDWPTAVPDLQLYLHESSTVENALLIAGFLTTAVVGVASYAARLAFAKHQAAWSQM